jgi:hypothetical protein
MARSHRFSIVRLAPGDIRDEQVNLGIAVFSDDDIEVRLPARLEKARLISAALDRSMIRELTTAIVSRDIEARASGVSGAEGRANAIGRIGPLSLSKLGTFTCVNDEQYESRIGAIMRSMVEPEAAPKVETSKKSRLLTELKKVLRQERILAKKEENLGSHRFVPNLVLAEGLVADLALKNGAMHIIETVDVSSEEATSRRAVADIAVSALVLEQARINYGEHKTRARLIYSASPTVEQAAQTCLDAAEHQGAEIINWASTQDQIKLLTTLASLAIPSETENDRRRRMANEGTRRLRLA